jgi:hypothetical protein
VHFDRAGVVRGELEQRVTLAADRKDDAVALELFDNALDFLTRGVGVETVDDVFDGEKAVSPLPEELDDRLMELRRVRRRYSVLRGARFELPVRGAVTRFADRRRRTGRIESAKPFSIV